MNDIIQLRTLYHSTEQLQKLKVIINSISYRNDNIGKSNTNQIL